MMESLEVEFLGTEIVDGILDKEVFHFRILFQDETKIITRSLSDFAQLRATLAQNADPDVLVPLPPLPLSGLKALAPSFLFDSFHTEPCDLTLWLRQLGNSKSVRDTEVFRQFLGFPAALTVEDRWRASLEVVQNAEVEHCRSQEQEQKQKADDMALRRALEDKVFQAQEFLISQPSVDRSTLEHLAPWLKPSHYDDVVQERMLQGMCGYPLCDQELATDGPDLTYCSEEHIVAAQEFVSGLTDTPLWQRDGAKEFAHISFEELISC
mmetsp:Transcript_44361/g.104194  ORF Transcript_44361/g.104194 Transcript_44361/m.104194 type:complete len:267 (-) Transcript_44361:90-890(-)